MAYQRKQVQISAFIAEETKNALDRYVEQTGLKKNRVIEEALRRHLSAVDEIPAEMMTELHLETAAEGWAMISDMIESDREPEPALVDMWERHFEFVRTSGRSLEDEIERQLAADGD